MTEELQAPAPAESQDVSESPDVEAPKAEAKPEKSAPKPKSDAEKRRASVENALKKVSGDSEEDVPPNGSPSTPKPASTDEKPDEKPDADAKSDDKPADAKAKAEGKPEDKSEDKEKAAQNQPEKAKADDKEASAPKGAEKPPARFSADAKAAWKDAPEPVKAEVQRAFKELEKGLQQKDKALKPLEPFMKMAQESGTTVDQALNNYVRMEQMLRENPAQGLRALAQNMGMTPQQMAATLTNQEPGQTDPRDRQIIQMGQKIQQMEQQFGQVSRTMQDQQESQTLAQINQFAAENPRFEELAPQIARLLETGLAADLEEAYEMAGRLDPAPAAPVNPAPAPPAQTRQALSVTGAPTGGSNPRTRKTSQTRKEAILTAMQQAGL